MKFLSTLATMAALAIAAVQGQNLTLGQLVAQLGTSWDANGFAHVVEMLGRDAEMSDLLNTGQDITFFAPINQAVWNRGNLNPFVSGEFMKYHIVIGSQVAPLKKQVVADTHLNAENSPLVQLPSGVAQKLVLSDGSQEGFISIQFGVPNLANTLSAGIQCTNGYFYPIDTYLLPPNNFIVTAQAFGLDAFVSALNATDMQSDELAKVGLTLFIPQQEILNAQNLSSMSKDDLSNFLKYHMADGAIYTKDMTDGQMIPSQNGKNVKASVNGNSYQINGHNIVIPNILTENGVIHVIDNVLKPEEATANKPNAPPAGNNNNGNAPPTSAEPQAQGNNAAQLLPGGGIVLSIFIAAVAVFAF